ncbi:MAG TPA: Gfo/Idh/MocA family oxidoreductase [Paludibacteraceae bacterium]|nr:Gfo/Idh/MocA family oxidoreductase [Paludibacteraceae bacterium]HQF49373.1 Gfo/Idh/MocA family oxidoreductase [Paludibacteraceae bacterium]HQJ88985.1 Gfo/Idh/MocA family oxidoreductase [Paludibacteraceae bacterium]
MRNYRWAILGAGHIAEKFSESLKVCQQAELYAVASRSLDKAENFRKDFGFKKAYGSYEEMLADPSVDIVYIATPNNLHFEHTMMSLNAGKAVLCEKPFGLNKSQVDQMIRKAQEKKLFLMEALWSRFLPSILKVKKEIEAGRIGTPKVLQAEFGFKAEYNENSRLFNPSLGGGSVFDIGIYPLFLSLYLFGYPTEIKAISIPAPTGTDMTTSMLLKHKNGEISNLTSSFALRMETDARIYGEKGYLKLHRMFHMPTKLVCKIGDEDETELPIHWVGNGYNYEALEVMKCLDEGLTESRELPFSFSEDLISLIDKVNDLIKNNI